MPIRLHARAASRAHGLLSYVTFLEYFAIETDALLSYGSVHYQDYSVNRAPIHRAFRAQEDISASEVRHRHRYGRAQATPSSSVKTASRLHERAVEYGSWP